MLDQQSRRLRSRHARARELTEEIKGRFDGLDILVNNAGITCDAMLHQMTEDQRDEVIRVNLKGPLNIGQACAKLMTERKSAKS